MNTTTPVRTAVHHIPGSGLCKLTKMSSRRRIKNVPEKAKPEEAFQCYLGGASGRCPGCKHNQKNLLAHITTQSVRVLCPSDTPCWATMADRLSDLETHWKLHKEEEGLLPEAMRLQLRYLRCSTTWTEASDPKKVNMIQGAIPISRTPSAIEWLTHPQRKYYNEGPSISVTTDAKKLFYPNCGLPHPVKPSVTAADGSYTVGMEVWKNVVTPYPAVMAWLRHVAKVPDSEKNARVFHVREDDLAVLVSDYPDTQPGDSFTDNNTDEDDVETTYAYECPDCCLYISTFHLLIQHQQEVHGLDPRLPKTVILPGEGPLYPCLYCGSTYGHQDLLRLHYIRFHGKAYGIELTAKDKHGESNFSQEQMQMLLKSFAVVLSIESWKPKGKDAKVPQESCTPEDFHEENDESDEDVVDMDDAFDFDQFTKSKLQFDILVWPNVVTTEELQYGLRSTVRESHPQKSLFFCDVCKAVYDDEHNCLHHCMAQRPTVWISYAEQPAEVHDVFHCSKCNYGGRTFISLKKHNREKHPPPFKSTEVCPVEAIT